MSDTAKPTPEEIAAELMSSGRHRRPATKGEAVKAPCTNCAELKTCLRDLLASYQDLKNLCGDKLPGRRQEPIEIWAEALLRGDKRQDSNHE